MARREPIPPNERWPAGEHGVTSRDVRLDGGTCFRVVEAGPVDGTPVVLLHGWAAASYTWRRLIPELAAAGYRVAAPDLLGHGLSDQPDEPAGYAPESLVRTTAALVDELSGGDKPVLVGHSFGGGLTLRLALGFPDRYRAVGLVNATGLGRVPIVPLGRFATPRFAVPLLQQLMGRSFVALSLRQLTGGRAALSDRDIDEYWSAVAGRQALVSILAILHRYDWKPVAEEQLAGLVVPTLVITGARDMLVPAMAENWPGWATLAANGARVVRIAEGYHMAPEEDPELVRTAVLELVAAATAG